ncbi:CPBP family intramembrane glutamic endopeptidase [Maritalea porphyrae]|jgi:membrane protease YdiL (CAAX protease family)|uniref:CPBP family intramembrane glutamic endopeptidase n=1 Tax=Maritalea porphyrae TaxID=880732 RepID=UPI0022AFAC00|nr:CPBP family intramembrane glutamic endopeptidase [Maritalea porphyrae]MCZ4272324.1 CPBP family intramembrane metalloprotease [Maritalea porphyrae]
MNKTKKGIFAFLIIETIIVALFSTLIILDGRGLSQNIPYALTLMLSPAIVGLGTSWFFTKSLKGFGWRLGSPKLMLVSYLIPLLYILVPYVFLLATGLVLLDASAMAELGLTEVIQFFFANILILCVLVLGEEIGWRGFLLPQLCKVTSFAKASTIVGVVWILVHFPIFIFADYNAGGAPLWLRLLCFTVLAFGVNLAINWLRIISGSLWTAVLLHTTHNSFLQDISPLFVKTQMSEYLLSESGIALALSGVVVGTIFWFKRKELDAPARAQT